jgi:hypothetical protein
MAKASSVEQEGLPLEREDAPTRSDPTESDAVSEHPEASEEAVEIEGEIVENGETTAIVEHAVETLEPESLARLATEDQIEKAITRLVARTRAITRYKAALLSITNVRDWYAHASEGDPDGVPYLAETGSSKVIHAFQIGVEHDGGQRVPVEDGGYEFVYSGRMRALMFSDIWYPVVGSRWSDDGFFTRGGTKTADPGDVRKAAHTSFLNRGIKTVCGIKSLTWEELECLPGLEDLRNRVPKIGYAKQGGGDTQPGELSEIEKGPHIKVKIPREDLTTREAIKGMPKRDRIWNGSKGAYYWVVRYNETNLKKVADLKAVNDAIYFKPFNVAAEDLPL